MQHSTRTRIPLQLTEAQLETAIAAAHRALTTATNMSTKAAAWRIFKRLHGMRSPAMIARMEVERGLAERT